MMSQTAIIQMIAAFFGSLGFALLFNIRGKLIFWTSFGGLLDWIIFILAGVVGLSEFSKYFLAALVLGLYSELMARLLKTPTTSFFVVGFIPLVPGSNLFIAMNAIIVHQQAVFYENTLEALSVALAITMGLITSLVIFNIYTYCQKPIHHLKTKKK